MTSRKGLAHHSVVDAASRLVEADGAEALTLSAVARELGVKPPSLYNHVSGLEGLRRDVALRATRDFADALVRAAMGRSGSDALRSVAVAFRSYATSHPGLYELTVRARPDDDEYATASWQAVEAAVAVMRGFDLDDEDAIHAVRVLRAALHGFVSLERDGGFGLDVDVDESFGWLVDSLIHSFERRQAYS